MKYPRLGPRWQRPKAGSTRACRVCGSVPAGLQDVEVSYMRGDDEVVACCDSCRRAPDAAVVLLRAAERKAP